MIDLQAALRQRGILNQAIKAGWQPCTDHGQPGFKYPAIKGQPPNRFKAIDANIKGRKYKWLPSKPDGCDFYLPAGEAALRSAVEAAGGDIWIANGEPGVLTYLAAGIENVLSAGFGEGTTPGHLADKLTAFGAKRVSYPVDKDNMGKRAATNWRDALKNSGIEFRPLAWGDLVPEKGDANDLWIAVNFDPNAFRAHLQTLDALILPQEPMKPPPRRISAGHNSSKRRDAIEQLERVYGITGTRFNAKGWSKNFKCFYHDEENASAGFNHKTGKYHCFVCGEKSLLEQCQNHNIDWQPYGPTKSRHQKEAIDGTVEPPAADPPTTTDEDWITWYPSGVPNSMREGQFKYAPKNAARLFEGLNEALKSGRLNRQSMTVDEMLTACNEQGIIFNKSALYRLLNQLFSPSVSKMRTSSLGLYVLKNETEGNTTYRAVPPRQVEANLIDWARPRIYERLHPVKAKNDDTVIAPITIGIIQDVIDTDESPAALAKEANIILSPFWDEQESRRQVRAKKCLAHLSCSLQDKHSTPLPEGWPLTTDMDFRVAYAQAVGNANPDAFKMSRSQICEKFGISDGVLGTFVKAAGWEATEQLPAVPIAQTGDVARQVERAARGLRGHPRYFVSSRAPNQRQPYDTDAPEAIACELKAGAEVEVLVQTANLYRVVREEPLVKEPAPPNPPRNGPPVNTEPSLEVVASRFGPTYNPVWVAAQLRSVLVRSGWIQRDERLVNLDTGEVIPTAATPTQLLEALLGRPVSLRRRVEQEMNALGWRKVGAA